ncbi:hypothetical protein FE773_03645 [Caminibacter mediatlanticus TB-2]|uniref:Uncharacterized protein n=1 Tax=Caminibacter mediatlanticus TB-2 TaxID=391592 RepID=A0AAI9AI43_9BACT|nr:hypothetical protein [Caminibacter mediatlanticus]EDM23940.1 hypothetical protein CMTB2_06791 [Caminibacter mediatlanticus TB-2]QCT94305.1 hypothetical protein FE773_03645 [Caminibacter mediatlanticus TB-2]
MKEIIDLLQKNRVICKKLEEIKLNTKKKIKAFLGVNLKNEYCLIVIFYKKSRFLNKDVEILREIEDKLKINFRYKRKYLILSGEICSKSKENLKDWRIFWF